MALNAVLVLAVAPLTEESFSKPMRSGLLSAAVISICVICVLGVFVVKKRNEKLVEAAQLPFWYRLLLCPYPCCGRSCRTSCRSVCVLAGAMLSLLFVSVSFQYPPTQSQVTSHLLPCCLLVSPAPLRTEFAYTLSISMRLLMCFALAV